MDPQLQKLLHENVGYLDEKTKFSYSDGAHSQVMWRSGKYIERLIIAHIYLRSNRGLQTHCCQVKRSMSKAQSA